MFRDFGEPYIKIYQPNLQTIKLIRSIRLCRTPALGGQKIICKGCGDARFQYHSCGNNQCPQCQGIKRLQWQDRLSTKMLAVPYVHTTFTLPHQLSNLARRNKGQIYGLLLRSCWKTVKALCKDESNVGAKPGMTSVLHTWGSDLKYHIHAHCLITFGGLTESSTPEWKWPKRKKSLADYRKFCNKFREVFLEGLEKLMTDGLVTYHLSFEAIKDDVGKIRWVVHSTHPTSDTKVIEEYLSRYICRIGITNSRLTYDANGKNVVIKYNDYKNQEEGQPAPKAFKLLHPLAGMHQILQHVVPACFQRVRHTGLHAGASYKKIKAQLPDTLKRNGKTVRTVIQILTILLKERPDCCKKCGGMAFEKESVPNNEAYLYQLIKVNKRGPPSKKAGQIKFLKH